MILNDCLKKENLISNNEYCKMMIVDGENWFSDPKTQWWIASRVESNLRNDEAFKQTAAYSMPHF